MLHTANWLELPKGTCNFLDEYACYHQQPYVVYKPDMTLEKLQQGKTNNVTIV